MHHEVGAEWDRLLKRRGEEGVVDDDECSVGVRAVRRGGDGADVGDAEERIARRLDPEELGRAIVCDASSAVRSAKASVKCALAASALKSRCVPP
jgi:hypothetical protein